MAKKFYSEMAVGGCLLDDLSLQVNALLGTSQEISFDVKPTGDASDPALILQKVTLNPIACSFAIPRFSCTSSADNDEFMALLEAKAAILRRTILFIELAQSFLSYTRDSALTVGTGMRDACALLSRHLACSETSFTEPSSVTNWIVKQRARFRIQRAERSAPALASNANSATAAESALAEICGKLKIDFPRVVFHELLSSGLLRCKVSCGDEAVELAERGISRNLLREAACKLLVERLQPRVAAASNDLSLLCTSACAAPGTLLVDVDLSGAPALAQPEAQQIPENIVQDVHSFARRANLLLPVYSICKRQQHWYGKVFFAEHCFQVEGKRYNSQVEAKAHLAFLIWKSIRHVAEAPPSQPPSDASKRKYSVQAPFSKRRVYS